jgi:transcriptional regulator with XRE-family HTH domain
MSTFDELRKKMSVRARSMAQNFFDDLIKQYPLGALRNAREMTQEQVAKAMGTSQVAVSKMESRRDFLLSSLSRYVRATGGVLRINISYKDAAFEIRKDEEEGFVLTKDFAPATAVCARLSLTAEWKQQAARVQQLGRRYEGPFVISSPRP